MSGEGLLTEAFTGSEAGYFDTSQISNLHFADISLPSWTPAKVDSSFDLAVNNFASITQIDNVYDSNTKIKNARSQAPSVNPIENFDLVVEDYDMDGLISQGDFSQLRFDEDGILIIEETIKAGPEYEEKVGSMLASRPEKFVVIGESQHGWRSAIPFDIIHYAIAEAVASGQKVAYALEYTPVPFQDLLDRLNEGTIEPLEFKEALVQRFKEFWPDKHSDDELSMRANRILAASLAGAKVYLIDKTARIRTQGLSELGRDKFPEPSGENRDVAMAKEITKLLSSGYDRVFAQVGNRHVLSTPEFVREGRASLEDAFLSKVQVDRERSLVTELIDKHGEANVLGVATVAVDPSGRADLFRSSIELGRLSFKAYEMMVLAGDGDIDTLPEEVLITGSGFNFAVREDIEIKGVD